MIGMCRHISLGILLLILTFPLLCLKSYSQDSHEQWAGSAFIEEPNGSYNTHFKIPEENLETIARSLQPKKKKFRVEGDMALIEMTYAVYEKAVLGTRPFGRIRYNIILKQDDQGLACSFQDFTFRKIERNPRYAKLEEVRGKPKMISTVRNDLSDAQWSILRWKTEGVINRKVSIISSHGLQALEME